MDKKKCLILFEHYIQNQATTEELEDLQRYIRNDKNLSGWLEQQIAGSPDEINVNVKKRMLKNIRQQIKNEDSKGFGKKKITMTWLRWVAIIAIPLALFVSLYYNLRTEALSALIVIANQGEKANVILPDGSKIAINSASKVTYFNNYNKKDRSLKLNGEAYFDVVHNKDKPFIVDCSGAKIKVLGTTFEIKAYKEDDEIFVVLRTGKIEMQTLNEKFTIHPNERIIYNKRTNKIYKEKVIASDFTDWRFNRLRFENETLGNIVSTISRMHNVKIRFEDENLKSQRFTGTVDNKNIRTVMDMISLTSSIGYKMQDSVIVLYKK